VQDFLFRPQQLASPRLPGISAVMRIKNGAEFLEATIRSHLVYFDEIVACYNDCTDQTAQILTQLATEFPDKIRIFHYEPQVHPILSTAHASTATFCLHSMANYYNYALAQCRYQLAVKLDDDHLAIAANMSRAVATVRAASAAGQMALFRFSGLNLAGNLAAPQVYRNCPLVGTGDIMFFPIHPEIFFVQAEKFETLQFGEQKALLPKRYLGVLYCHLKHLKADYGFANLAEPARSQHCRQYLHGLQLQSLPQFCTAATQQELIQDYGLPVFWLRQQPWFKWVLRRVGKENPLRMQRLETLSADLAAINWQQDVLHWLTGAATTKTAHQRYPLQTSSRPAHSAWSDRMLVS
jgi:hypothetical protein